jgi:ComEC/Rec2-related protein
VTDLAGVVPRTWVILAATCAGLWAGWYLSPGVEFVLPSGLFLCASLVPLRRRKALLLLPAAFLAGMVMASTRASRQAALHEMAETAPECTVSGSVTEVSGLGSFASIHRAGCNGFAVVADAGTVAVDDRNLKLGDEFEAKGNLASLSDDPFDVARSRLGVDAIFYADDMQVQPARGLSAAPSAFRSSMERAASHLETKTGALLMGLTIGDTSGFDEQTMELFRRSGLAHLLAVSGSNVAIVVGTVALCVARTSARARLLTCAATLGFYVMVVGPDPSVVRAAAMGALGLAGMIWGHRPEALAGLALALIVALAIRPAFLFSVGLHLSAAATAGLVLWSRPLATRLAFRMPVWIAWPLGATLAAQIAVAPLLALTFGEVSIVAPLANLAALPAVAPATVLGLAAAVAGVASDAAGAVVGAIASPLSAWIVLCAETFGGPSWAQISVPAGLAWAGLALVFVAGLFAARRGSGVH